MFASMEIILCMLLGLALGIITGLTPGIHVNLVAITLVSLAPLFRDVVSPVGLAVAIIATAITHSFLDPLPSIFLGAPEGDTALGVLPGHRFLLKGQGAAAMMLTLIGSYAGLVVSLGLFPVFVWLGGIIYPFLQPAMGWVLLVIVAFMVWRDRYRWWALLVFLLSGCLGLLVFDLQLKQPLFPLLTGLFGISTLLYSLYQTSSLPRQTNTVVTPSRKILGKSLGAGVISGWLTALLPGIGAATAAVLSLQIVKKLGDIGFMVLLGVISTVNFSLSLATLWAIDKARNGALIAVQELVPSSTPQQFILYGIVALIAGSIAVFLGKRLVKPFTFLVTSVPYRPLVLGVTGFLLILTLVLSGWLGLVVLIVAMAVGFIPAIKKTSRVHAMGCLLLPVMTYFLF